ncbi:uncharacterized protein LOC106669318 isoform X2 [Cimex lectularius]|nr:uncharacterized protein LOC106669318 isoform X2 [Cimex lectularius]
MMCETVLRKGDLYKEEFLSCSTALTSRRSVSLLDVSGPEKELNHKTISNDTIGSHTSIFKDSGYNQTGSSSSLGSTKDREQEKRITDLEEELKYKQVLINELQESNQTLRMKFAEAENKISELRLKCESHCKCCTAELSGPGSESESEAGSIGIRYPRRRNHSPQKLYDTDPNRFTPVDESYQKVKRWQDELVEEVKRTSELSFSRDSVNSRPKSRYTHHTPTPSEGTLNSRVLISTPCQTKIGNHSIKVLSTKSVVPSRRQKDGSISQKLRQLHNESCGEYPQKRYFSASCPNSSSDDSGDESPVNYHGSNRWSERDKQRVDDRLGVPTHRHSSCGQEHSGFTYNSVGSYNCRNRKLEMEQKIRHGMNKIANFDRERITEDSSMPFECWKETLRPKTVHGFSSTIFGTKNKSLLKVIREALTMTTLATDQLESIWKRNKKC